MTELIALMGFFVLAGTAYAPAQAEETPIIVEAQSTTIAQRDEVALKRDVAGEFTVKLTAYNAVPEQTDANPAVTASGATSNPEVIAARSHDLASELPFGTVIAITGPAANSRSCGYEAVEHLIGYRVIADTTHSRKKQQIDVLMDPSDTVTLGAMEINPAKALGICDGSTIKVVGRIKVSEIPATQAELIEIVEGGRLAYGN